MLPGQVSQLRSPPPSYQPRKKWCTSQKQREVCFDLPRRPPPKVLDMTASNNSPPSGPKGWTCPRGCPRVLIVHQWHFRKSEASFPWLVQTVCLLLVAAEIFGLEEIHNYRSWLWASDNEQSGRPGAHHRLLGRQYNVLCNNWKLPAKITKIKAPRCFKVSREGVFFYLQKRRQKRTLKTFHETM